MAGEATVTFVGNVGADPELRFTSNGDSVASFPVGVTPRTKQGDDWVDQDTMWFRVSAWKYDAEATVEHVTKGARVKITGRLKASIYEAKDGSSRLSLDVTSDPNGVTLVPKAPPKERVHVGGADPWS